MRFLRRPTVADGKTHPSPPYTYLTQIGNHKKDDEEAEEGRADHRNVDPQAAHLGVRRRLVQEKPKQLEQEEGDVRDGRARRTLAAAEHACSTPRSKWSAEC